MKIAQASARTGISIDTLRYYEKAGLVSPRRQSGQRIYSAQDLDDLDSIVRLRALGISITEIRKLLEIDRTIGNLETLSPEEMSSLTEVQSWLQGHIDHLEKQIEELTAMLGTFKRMASKLSGLMESGGLSREP